MDTTLIYNKIKELVEKNGITANKLLLDCKINSSFLNDLKSKNVKPSIEKILKISEYFNVSIDYLVTGTQSIETVPVDQQELLDLYNQLDPIKQAEFKGELKVYLKAKNNN